MISIHGKYAVSLVTESIFLVYEYSSDGSSYVNELYDIPKETVFRNSIPVLHPLPYNIDGRRVHSL